MTQIDFYILSEQMQDDRYQFACKLVEKVYGQGHRVYIHTDSDGEVRHLDRLLWTFREQSFVPHGAIGASDPGLTPVLLGTGEAPEREDDVMINLAAEVPGFFNRFKRVAEIIDVDPEVKRVGRTRFRFYKDRGYPLKTHQLT
jgi:DNA polymerase-3 subunit chi